MGLDPALELSDSLVLWLLASSYLLNSPYIASVSRSQQQLNRLQYIARLTEGHEFQSQKTFFTAKVRWRLTEKRSAPFPESDDPDSVSATIVPATLVSDFRPIQLKPKKILQRFRFEEFFFLTEEKKVVDEMKNCFSNGFKLKPFKHFQIHKYPFWSPWRGSSESIASYKRSSVGAALLTCMSSNPGRGIRWKEKK